MEITQEIKQELHGWEREVKKELKVQLKFALNKFLSLSLFFVTYRLTSAPLLFGSPLLRPFECGTILLRWLSR